VNLDIDTVEVPGRPPFEHHVIRFPRASVGAVVVNNSDEVLLLWRHRFTTNTWGWEIPAGWSDDGEDPTTAVIREIIEETGHRPIRVEPMTTYSPLTGICSQRYRLFVAYGAERVARPIADGESTRIEWISLTDVPRLAAEGLIPDGPSLTALTYFLAVARQPL
jgi:8-oxo-dGTP pyrophosphatase MutT (NUDIX family)